MINQQRPDVQTCKSKTAIPSLSGLGDLIVGTVRVCLRGGWNPTYTPTYLTVAGLTELGEAEVGGVLTEALTAHVELVLADEGLLVAADHAVAGALALLDLLAGTPLLEVTHVSFSTKILVQRK